jgi:Xaa-Pro aminopeptidase
MMAKILFSFLLFCFTLAVAQKTEVDSSVFKFQYDKDMLTKDFHKERREALRAKMKPNSVAVFFANPVRNRSNDVDFQYHQDPDFYYLTGLKEPNSLLIVFKQDQIFDSVSTNEIIFIQSRDPKKEVWDGRRLGKNGVNLVLGFKNIRFNHEFEDFKIDFSTYSKVYHKKLSTDVSNKELKGDLSNLIFNFLVKTKDLNNVDANKLPELMASLREVKLEEEMVLLKKAINATCLAHIELMKALKPGMTEFQSQALLEYFFKHFGAEYPGFPSILGAGENACILHYTTNRRTLFDADLLVADVGAEYHGYTADVTRTLPVNGKFSTEQKIIYDIVLEAQNAGIDACKAGNKFFDPNQKATEVIQKRLIEHGIIKSPMEVRLYFMHGTSHYLGLDVHDAGLYGKLTPGNVITVEPGIYIPEGSPCDPKWWNIGVRIEDDILITSGAPVNLSVLAPRTTEEIEELMKEESIFNTIIK